MERITPNLRDSRVMLALVFFAVKTTLGTICPETVNGDVGTLEVSAEGSSQRVIFVVVKYESIIGRE